MNQSAEARAEEAISFAAATANAAAEAIGARMDLEASRALEKDFAIRRMMTEAEGRGEKATYTGCEKTVEGEPTYAAFLKALRVAVVDEEKAKGRAVAAKLQAQLAIARVQVLGGVA